MSTLEETVTVSAKLTATTTEAAAEEAVPTETAPPERVESRLSPFLVIAGTMIVYYLLSRVARKGVVEGR